MDQEKQLEQTQSQEKSSSETPKGKSKTTSTKSGKSRTKASPKSKPAIEDKTEVEDTVGAIDPDTVPVDESEKEESVSNDKKEKEPEPESKETDLESEKEEPVSNDKKEKQKGPQKLIKIGNGPSGITLPLDVQMWIIACLAFQDPRSHVHKRSRSRNADGQIVIDGHLYRLEYFVGMNHVKLTVKTNHHSVYNYNTATENIQSSIQKQENLIASIQSHIAKRKQRFDERAEYLGKRNVPMEANALREFERKNELDEKSIKRIKEEMKEMKKELKKIPYPDGEAKTYEYTFCRDDIKEIFVAPL